MDIYKGQVAVDGGLGTWSLVVRDGTYFAVSAAHCALLFGGSTDRTFVPLPQSVLRCGVVSVCFLASPSWRSEFGATSIKREYDFVAVELKEKPVARVAVEATWPVTPLLRGSITGCSVVGLTNSFPVSGVNAKYCTTDDGNDCVFRRDI
jgi:hypothetical protein